MLLPWQCLLSRNSKYNLSLLNFALLVTVIFNSARLNAEGISAQAAQGQFRRLYLNNFFIDKTPPGLRQMGWFGRQNDWGHYGFKSNHGKQRDASDSANTIRFDFFCNMVRTPQRSHKGPHFSEEEVKTLLCRGLTSYRDPSHATYTKFKLKDCIPIWLDNCFLIYYIDICVVFQLFLTSAY